MRTRPSARAFTLLEVLLALSLLAGVAGAALGLLSNLTRRQEQIRAHSDRALGGGLLIDRLEQALGTSFAQDIGGEAGVRGDDHSIQVRHRGVVGPAEQMTGDRRSIELHWSDDGVVTGSFTGDGAGEANEPIAERVERFRLRYFHGARWRSSFDSVSAGELPSAIEVAIWFEHLGEGNRSPTAEEIADEFGEGMADLFDPQEEASPPIRLPDRLRVIVVPDAPSASWEVGG